MDGGVLSISHLLDPGIPTVIMASAAFPTRRLGRNGPLVSAIGYGAMGECASAVLVRS